MSSRIGRKSSFSKELSQLREPLNNIKEGVVLEKEVVDAIVLDICSSYKKTSIFIDDRYLGYKNFDTGIYFIIGMYGYEQVAVVAWKKSEDELRMTYGTDSNIIGRECKIVCDRITPDSLLRGDIVFSKSLRATIKSYNQSEYMSNSFFSNTETNYLDQLKGVSKTSGFGETWREVKPK